jgi:HCOMODA/2-hydroxy-3-carboxy-muconic semialdehyde decarboxylase
MESVQGFEAQQRRVRIAARALGHARLAHAYGHCSLRLDDGHFLVCAPRPMALVAPGEPGCVVPVDGPLPEGVLGEVRIHQQIYRRRPDVGGIARFQSPRLMTLSTLDLSPSPRHGFGAYFAPSVPLWSDPRLLRNDSSAQALATQLGTSSAIVMRGNGAVTVARTLENAVVLAWYLEDAARVELEVRACGLAGQVLSADEARDRAITDGRLFERMWDYLSAGDPEVSMDDPAEERHDS